MASARGRAGNQVREFERQLVLARSGSAEAIGQLLQACQRYLLMTANRELESWLRPKQGASDLVQQTFFFAQRDFKTFRGTTPGELAAWLRQILQHQLNNQVRYYKLVQKRTIRREILLDVADHGLPLKQSESPSEALSIAEEQRRVRMAMERLPDDYRAVLTMRTWQELPFAEIGRLLNRSSEAAEKLWLRAVARLQQELKNVT